MGYEIERKFLVDKSYAKKYEKEAEEGKYRYHIIEQVYLTVNPVIRVRRTDDEYSMTYKGSGFLVKEEYNLPLTEESYNTLMSKREGNLIKKKRINIPYEGKIIELDIFDKPFEDLIIAEVEFDSVEEAEAFNPPEWFLEDVTGQKKYTNSYLSRLEIK